MLPVYRPSTAHHPSLTVPNTNMSGDYLGLYREPDRYHGRSESYEHSGDSYRGSRRGGYRGSRPHPYQGHRGRGPERPRRDSREPQWGTGHDARERSDSRDFRHRLGSGTTHGDSRVLPAELHRERRDWPGEVHAKSEAGAPRISDHGRYGLNGLRHDPREISKDEAGHTEQDRLDRSREPHKTPYRASSTLKGLRDEALGSETPGERNKPAKADDGASGSASMAGPKKFNDPWIPILRLRDPRVTSRLESRYNELSAVNEKLALLQAEKIKLSSALLTLEVYAARDALNVEICGEKLDEFTYL